jgi:beta-lactamase class A
MVRRLVAVGFLIVLALPLLPASNALALDNQAFQRTWVRTDKPVLAHEVSRTWMWGPPLTGSMQETALDAPGGTREVQYFDKARMEAPIDPNADPSSIWYVTTGLLAKELVTGQLQDAANHWEPRAPATINIAGDPGDTKSPTYLSFNGHLKDKPIPNGWLVTQRIDRAGKVTDAASLGSYGVTAHYRVTVPGLDHQVASVFWEFMNSSGMVYENGYYGTAKLFLDPFYATGLPITEPYWTTVTVAGTDLTVLVQVFERRVLTYNPSNPPEWRVEMGNVGRHYYEWRYGAVPNEPQPPVVDFMDDLQDRLGPLVNSWGGLNAVAVTDLQTGKTISVNGDRQHLPACTIKVFIMMAVAQDLEAGRYSEGEVIDLIYDAMGPSNTWPARELIRYAGGGSLYNGVHRVNDIMQSLGMTRSVLDHPPGYPEEEYGYGYEDNYLTANDMNLALSKLYKRQAGLSEWATNYVLWSMTIAIPGQQYSLGGGIPWNTNLYHKIGLLYAPLNTWNDAGIVTFERNGQTYAYAISYFGSYTADWHDAYYHGADVSSVTWEAFSAAYP